MRLTVMVNVIVLSAHGHPGCLWNHYTPSDHAVSHMLYLSVYHSSLTRENTTCYAGQYNAYALIVRDPPHQTLHFLLTWIAYFSSHLRVVQT